MFCFIWVTSGFASLYLAYAWAKKTKKGIVCSDFADLILLIVLGLFIILIGTISLAGVSLAYLNDYFNKRFSRKKPFVVVKGNDARG